MAVGKAIIVSSKPGGKFLRGKVVGTPRPGTLMELDPTASVPVDGNFSYRVFQRGTDGQRCIIQILLNDDLQGRPATQAYADGDACQLYVPLPGEELNILKMDVVGTADDWALGDYLIHDSGTGKFIKTTGSPQMEPFQSLENVVDPTSDMLVHCRYTGC